MLSTFFAEARFRFSEHLSVWKAHSALHPCQPPNKHTRARAPADAHPLSGVSTPAKWCTLETVCARLAAETRACEHRLTFPARQVARVIFFGRSYLFVGRTQRYVTTDRNATYAVTPFCRGFAGKARRKPRRFFSGSPAKQKDNQNRRQNCAAAEQGKSRIYSLKGHVGLVLGQA